MFLSIVKCQVAKNNAFQSSLTKIAMVYTVISPTTTECGDGMYNVDTWQRHELPSQDFINQAIADSIDILLEGLDGIFKPSGFWNLNMLILYRARKRAGGTRYAPQQRNAQNTTNNIHPNNEMQNIILNVYGIRKWWLPNDPLAYQILAVSIPSGNRPPLHKPNKL